MEGHKTNVGGEYAKKSTKEEKKGGRDKKQATVEVGEDIFGSPDQPTKRHGNGSGFQGPRDVAELGCDRRDPSLEAKEHATPQQIPNVREEYTEDEKEPEWREATLIGGHSGDSLQVIPRRVAWQIWHPGATIVGFG